MPTKQETFDEVAYHLLSQGQQALDEEGECRYRTPEGMSCAAGCLIPDDLYRAEFEGDSVAYCNSVQPTDVGRCIVSLGHDLELVAHLQDIHDMHSPNSWPIGLALLADEHDLSTKILDDFDGPQQT